MGDELQELITEHVRNCMIAVNEQIETMLPAALLYGFGLVVIGPRLEGNTTIYDIEYEAGVEPGSIRWVMW